jgi:hypothetical protein
VEPLRVRVEDVGAPGDDAVCGCRDSNPDGIPDLVLAFDNQEVLTTLRLERSGTGSLETLTIIGNRRSLTGSGLHRFEFGMDGSQEVPARNTLGKGACTTTLDPSSGNVAVGCTYEGMSGVTMASHIHGLVPPGTNAPVIVPLVETGDRSGTITGGGTLTPVQIQGMLDGLTYVNLHTDLFPGGEIRGQVVGGEAFSASDCVLVVRHRVLGP